MVGKVLAFTNRPECPPHDWTPIYDELDEDGAGLTETISGKICLKCSLIETKRSLALFRGESRGTGKGSLRLVITPTIELR
jgi:hypothetical protein